MDYDKVCEGVEQIVITVSITKYPNDFLGVETDGSIKEVWFQSDSHKTKHLAPGIREDITLTIPLLPIVYELWIKITGEKFEIRNGYYQRLEVHEKELLDKINSKGFNSLTIKKNSHDEDTFATFSKILNPSEIKNIPKFLSMQTFCDITLQYGADPGKILNAIVVNKIKPKIIKNPQGGRNNRN
jgi:hypothetical protein